MSLCNLQKENFYKFFDKLSKSIRTSYLANIIIPNKQGNIQLLSV